ncbi:unnamed protein product, partial [Hydatigera taeniaeformis]|uniref:BACK domain-containing protein n=1 Tax=Hydatigena taeniaeformis TaxID=6205 RepID=A0A0R3WQ54_HYDTA
MEKAKKIMYADICKYLNGSDIVSVCEALPHIKCILFSKAIVEVLRKYVSTMQWVDATVYRWIYSAISMSKSAESEKTNEEEAELLYKVIQCYRDDRQYRKNFIRYDLPCTDRVFHIL